MSEQKLPESAGITLKDLWCVSLYKLQSKEDPQRPMKTSKVLAQPSNARECFLSLWDSVYILFLNITHPLQCLFSAKHHMTSQKTALRKISRDTTELLTNEKFPLQISQITTENFCLVHILHWILRF